MLPTVAKVWAEMDYLKNQCCLGKRLQLKAVQAVTPVVLIGSGCQQGQGRY